MYLPESVLAEIFETMAQWTLIFCANVGHGHTTTILQGAPSGQVAAMASRPYSIATRMPASRHDNRGRKQRYFSQQVMEVWLYVEVGKARTGLSALKFCERREFHWLKGGCLLPREQASRKTGRLVVTHMAHGKTLRRRYQEAVAILRAESEPYRRLSKMGVRSSVFGAVSPTEEWWRRELKARLIGG